MGLDHCMLQVSEEDRVSDREEEASPREDEEVGDHIS